MKLIGIILKAVQSGLLLLSCMMFNIAVGESSDPTGESSAKAAGKAYAMWVGTCSYFWIPFAYLILVFFEKGPERLLNLCCCVCFAIMALAAGAIMIDEVQDSPDVTDSFKERKEKILAAGSFNIIVAVVYLVDGILIFMNE
ncbi:hypothetical protein L9F63_019461 [Diploptera punctata]|uniref:Uncharacterized protein n=1 Tax=Diploptera punctata TaxID=6984 RepID=A0AAD7ZU70_DIPPU|nr:hypothetical protein L9F63_019461 [Diploptera punctata]